MRFSLFMNILTVYGMSYVIDRTFQGIGETQRGERNRRYREGITGRRVLVDLGAVILGTGLELDHVMYGCGGWIFLLNFVSMYEMNNSGMCDVRIEETWSLV